MSLQKTSVDFNFASGVDTLTDSTQLPLGRFTDLQNSVFIQNDGVGKLDKRFGFDQIASFSGTSYVTTFKSALLGVGNNLFAYSNSVTATLGYYQPLGLSVLPLNRNLNYPTVIDSARAANGFIGYIYRSLLTSAGVLTSFFSGSFYYSVVDGDSGQQMIPPTLIPQGGGGAQVYPGRIFSLNNKFVITYDGTTGSAGASSSILNYITIDQTNLSVSGPTLLSSDYKNASSNSVQIAHDGFVAGNTLYVVMSGSQSGSMLVATINSAYVASATQAIASTTADMVSVTGDTSSGTTIYATFGNYKASSYKVVAFDQNLNTRFSAKPVISSAALSTTIVNLTCGAKNGVVSTFIENGVTNGTITNSPFNMITGVDITVNGVIASGSFTQPIQRQAGLGSKAFAISSQICFLSMYYGPNQSTYFLTATNGTAVNTIGKMAYGNAYTQYTLPSTLNLALGLPSASVIGSSAQIAFLETTTIQPVSKVTKSGTVSTNSSLYTTPGINVSTWNFNPAIQSSEIENNLHLSGGFLWSFDGGSIVEQNFFLYPDKILISNQTTGGRMAPDTYFYSIIYRWQDNQGNIHRSAPSVPVQVTQASGQSQLSVNVNVLGFTQRNPGNPVSIQCYRWGTNQQTYYKLPVDIVLAPGNFGTDLTTFADLYSDPELLGNEILYTTGGVVEDTGLPAISSLALFDTRLWAISSEDENLLYFSKPGVEAAPIEMSDLQTYFVPPNISGVSVPGGNKCIYGMDDKLIVFKKNAIAYINGIGPDSTGAQNGYSNPILITNGVGCTRPNSIVLIPQGLMFQSDKGIWLLGRDLSISFVGKEVEKFADCEVKSALTVPGTNEARFTLGSSGQTLVYDYFAQQWNQLTNVPAVSSTIYQSKHASIDGSGNVSLQSVSGFADNGTPTVMKWTTGWINLMGLQGYARAYRLYLLGKFLSPHTYTIGIAYDYNPQIVQTETINPYNSVGSGSQVEQWQVNFQNQQCQSFQLTFNEISSSTAGAGLSLSGVKVVFGAKKDFPRNLGIRNKV